MGVRVKVKLRAVAMAMPLGGCAADDRAATVDEVAGR
jgi:hypothetical protein